MAILFINICSWQRYFLILLILNKNIKNKNKNKNKNKPNKVYGFRGDGTWAQSDSPSLASTSHPAIAEAGPPVSWCSTDT